MKKLLSFLIAISMICGVFSAFAETYTNDYADDTLSSNQIETMSGNILLQQNSAVDVIFAISSSSSMYYFDPSLEMTWLSNFEIIKEQLPLGSRIGIVSESSSCELTSDYSIVNSVFTDIKNNKYNGSKSIQDLLNECVFDDTTANAKIVISVTPEITDINEYNILLSELQNNNIIPFTFILSNNYNTEIEDTAGLYQATSELKLRLLLSDLYYAMSEMSEINTMSIDLTSNTRSITNGDYLSDFRIKNIFSGTTDKGAKLASVLSIYGNVPLTASATSNSYDLSGLTGEKLDAFMVADNASFSNGENLNNFYATWNEIYDELKNSSNTSYFNNSAQMDIVIKNLKRKFPVVLERNGSYDIISKYNVVTNELYLNGNDNTSISAASLMSTDIVFDTYEYLMDSIRDDKEIKINVTRLTNIGTNTTSMEIEMSYPSTYSSISGLYPVNEVITSLTSDLVSDTGVSIDKTTNPITLTIEHQADISNRYVLVASQVEYTDGLPNLYSGNKLFRDLMYIDESDPSIWYYPYLFKLTNLGVINGDDQGNFNRNGNVTRAEFITMALRAAEIQVSPAPEGKHWAYNNLKTAMDLGMIEPQVCIPSAFEASVDTIADVAINRAEAAYILDALFIGAADSVSIPTLVYDFTTQELTNSKMADWTKKTAFTDQKTSIATCVDYERAAIEQMYLNGIIEGKPDNNGSTYYAPNDNLSRAECSVIISRCLFSLEENVKTVNGNIRDDYADSINGELSPLVEGIAKNGYLETANDTDWFIFTPSEGASYKIYTTGTTDTYGKLFEDNSSSRRSIFENDNAPAKKSTDLADCNFILARTLERDKPYYIEVSSITGDMGAYSIVIERITKPNELLFNWQWGLFNDGTLTTLQVISTPSPSQPSATPTTTYVPMKAGIDINVLPLWEYTKGDGITVGVVDTGIDFTNPDLSNQQSNIINGYDFLHQSTQTFYTDEDIFDSSYFAPLPTPYSSDEYNIEIHRRVYNLDTSGHGTHVAGIIAAEENKRDIIGVAPEAELVSLKELGGPSASASFTESDVFTILDDAVAYAKQNNIDILNFSMQCGFDPSDINDMNQFSTLTQLMISAQDILFVVAAGNDGEDLDQLSTSDQNIVPLFAQVPNMIRVANIDGLGELNDTSNYGSNWIHVAAPGTGIYSTVPKQTHAPISPPPSIPPVTLPSYSTNTAEMTGTSMAAPMVSGIAALIWSYDKTLTAKQVKDKIVDSASVQYLKSCDGKIASKGTVDAFKAFCNTNAVVSVMVNEESYDELFENNIKSYIKDVKENTDEASMKTELYVSFKNNVNTNDCLSSLIGDIDYEIVQSFKSAPMVKVKFTSMVDMNSAFSILNNSDLIMFAEPVYK